MLSTDKISVDQKAQSSFFHVKCNTAWTVSSSQTWCVLQTKSGGEGTIKVDLAIAENTTAAAREATVTVQAGNLSQTLSITQAGADVLNISQDSVSLSALAQELAISVESSANLSYSSSSTWIKDLTFSGNQLKFSTSENLNFLKRTGTIDLQSGDLKKVLTVHQSGKDFYIPADKNGMVNNAPELAKNIKIGWNLGNSLEAASDPNTASETLWGNPKTSKALIDLVKKSGFNAIRIPTAWSGYIEDAATYRLSDAWVERVKEVVAYCLDNDMYAIINIHWDGGWLENNPTYAQQASVNKKQKALWEQIAVVFRDYDEHLLFAGTNEVHAGYNAPSAENLAVQMSYNQTFVDAVRSTGGKNTWRNLIVQGYNTNIEYTVNYLKLPKDPTANRTFVEVHYYDPWDFCGEEGAGFKYLWGKNFTGNAGVSSWGQEAWLDQKFKLMKTTFGDKGYPVILGEFAATYRGSLAASQLANHIQARNYYHNYLVKTAKTNSLLPFYWDNGVTGNLGSGIFNRASLTVVHPETVEALVSGTNGN